MSAGALGVGRPRLSGRVFDADGAHRDIDDGASHSVVDRALLIIGTFRDGRARQSLSEISRATGIPVATCFRIVQRLTSWGALERDGEGKYGIGLKLWEVATLAPRSVGLQRLARPFLLDLYESTGHAAHLAIRDGLELVTIEDFQSPRGFVHRPVPGARYPLHVTAIGQVLLAYAPREVQQEVLSRELVACTPRTYTDRATLERVLGDIRRIGYAVSDRQVNNSDVGVAAPVRLRDGRTMAAVSLAFTDRDVDGHGIIQLVRLTATSIARVLDDVGYGAADD